MALTKVPSNLDATVATTQSASDNSTNVATTAYVTTALSNLVDSSPSALNTLNELAAALGDDANFSTTVTNSIATKLPLAGGTLTGELGIGVTPQGSWSSNYPALQIGQGATFTGHISNTQTQLGQNWWVGTGNQYVVNGAASRLVMGPDSSITFSQAPSGTAGATMSTITNPLVINASGNATFANDVTIGGDLTDVDKIIINKSNFSSLPTGSMLNVFGDGVTLRLDGTGATTKSILFRGTNVANPGEVYADGSLRFRTEDASTRITFHTNSTGSNNERMRIDGSGNVGIGDAPSSFTNAALHVAKDMGSSVTAVTRLRGRNTTARTTRLQFEDYNGAIADGLIDFHFPNAGSNTGAYFGMGYNAGNQLAINQNGYVGIGTTTPTEALEVAGTIKITGSNRLLLPNFWIGPVPNTTNNNHGAALIADLTTLNAANVGFQFSGSIAGNSYTGQAFANVNIVKNYSNDAVAYDVADDQNLNSVVSRIQLQLVTLTYNSRSYLAIKKSGGGTGTLFLNGYFQGWDPSVITEVATGTYTVTTTHGNINY